MNYLFIVFSALQFFMGFLTYLECFCIDLQMMFDEIDNCFADDHHSRMAIPEAQQRLIGVIEFHIKILR